MSFGEKLQQLRKEKGLSQEDLAYQLNVSRQAVAKWENGDSIPDLINCAALADLYDVSVDDLLYYDGEIEEVSIAPKGKHLFGTTVIGERGQIVIPKQPTCHRLLDRISHELVWE